MYIQHTQSVYLMRQAGRQYEAIAKPNYEQTQTSQWLNQQPDTRTGRDKEATSEALAASGRSSRHYEARSKKQVEAEVEVRHHHP
jgi:hypothetical protein